MNEFLQAILTFPTAIFSLLLGLVLLYWLSVILGLFDLELFDLDVDVGLDGALDGAVDGALDGLGEGADVAEAGDVDGPGGFAGLLAMLGLAGVPLTISLSIIITVGWFLCLQGMKLVGGISAAGFQKILLGSGVAVVAFLLGVAVAAVAVRPLRPLFITQRAAMRRDFVGRECRVTTGRVDDGFGQAEVEDGGAGLLVQVRCLEDNHLTRDTRALIYKYDRQQEVYFVVPYDAELAAAGPVPSPEPTSP